MKKTEVTVGSPSYGDVLLASLETWVCPVRGNPHLTDWNLLEVFDVLVARIALSVMQ
jgi:hypothetical protein